MSAEQVLTPRATGQSGISSVDQTSSQDDEVPAVVVASLLVRVGTQTTGADGCARARTQPRDERVKAARRRRAKRRRGGWPGSAFLWWQEVKEIDSIVHELSRHDCAPTHLVTIMPAAGDASARKRVCTRMIAHLGQALKRHGKLHIGLTVFEHSVGADLHAHHLLYVPPGEYATVERRHRPPEVHVERIRNLGEMTDYITKERRRLTPDFEATIRRSWQPTRRLPGKRWTITGDAKALLGGSPR